MKRRRSRPSPVVFCGPGNRVCARKDVARAIREQAKAAAAGGALGWR